ncbi:hypothetical protein OKA04_04355 [Luteolibacter flavescens]|uniref:PepSY domain-containing protein n=1 Tax=Luteolibacter flavescens TaxID=1859460 RepID=A0ABT3FK65_9BACT|nr:hypothetical protein [Luteolibacter flavescens]MCW1883947.1 hypothetical protein [Luteolibacter flavescens]
MKALLPVSALATVLSLAACKPEPKPAAEAQIPAPATPVEEPAAPAPTPNPAKPESYVGLEEKAAGDMADKASLKWRIIEVDGESRPVTMDFNPERLNFAIKDGKVIRVTQG